MWLPLSQVAKERRVDEDKLTAYALSKQNQYGIVIQAEPLISTWYIDPLISDFKKEQQCE